MLRPSADFAFRLLSSERPNGLVAVEIGVLKGENALAMLTDGNIELLFLVDPYGDSRGYDQEQECNVVDPDQNEAEAHERLKLYENRMVWRREPSAIAAPTFEDGTLDYVYIDGDHRYEHVLADADAWLPKVCSGGVLAGHDYHQEYQPELHAGVTRAVDEFVQKHGLELHSADVDWWIVKP